MQTIFSLSEIIKSINIMKKAVIILIIFLVGFSTLRSQYVFPCGGEDGYGCVRGTTQAISWSKYFMDTTRSIDILLWNADSVSFTTLATDVPVTDEYYMWSIPSNHPLGNHYKMKIVYHNGFLPQFKYVSNGFFSIKSSILQQSIPAIITKSNTNTFTLYPNPTSDVINIGSDNKFFGIDIYDILGALVLHRRFSYTNDYVLTKSELGVGTGTYTVVVRFMGSVVSKQLSIE